jgi:phosphatidate cytidylyltransferase
LLLACAVLLLAREWARLTEARGGAVGPGWLAGGSAALVGLLTVALASYDAWLPALGLVLASALLAAAASFLLSEHTRTARWLGFGLLYFSLPTLAMAWLRAMPEIGLGLLIWLLLVVWATDICAYVAGRAVGGPKLAPRISPGKTWSGLAGGMLGAAICGGVVTAVAAPERIGIAMLLGLALAAVAQMGDLLQSRLKRQAGMKDTGRLIPGHGGLLDRVDGLLAAAPALALVGWLVGPEAMPWR